MFLSKSYGRAKESLSQLKLRAKKLKKEVRVLYLACRRPDVPWYAKAAAILVVGYALSPIDLIPDFIPVLGYLDDIILIPLGIALVIKLIPGNILEECRVHADEVFNEGKPKNWIAGGLIICLWVLLLGYIVCKVFNISL